ncbi:340_t:CDS:2 [Diversispora eburnea]|uniref:340_t:CDS:1 n=1 Tax=Diversispora eburnea TaxID=1213867 RepID=A0A9N9GC95_9GLOM|nr:340_t:CDS:2 [Diversispora eburnea]
MESTFFSDMADDFKQLFETMEELEDDILRCYMVPDAKPTLNMFPSRKIDLDTDKNNISGATIGRISPNYYNYAVYCHSSYGPTFGAGNDLYCPNGTNNWNCNPNSYNNISLPSSFTVSDWEVFKVVKKA